MYVLRYFVGVVLVENKIYVFGGVGGVNVIVEYKKFVDCFDFGEGKWVVDMIMLWVVKYF